MKGILSPWDAAAVVSLSEGSLVLSVLGGFLADVSFPVSFVNTSQPAQCLNFDQVITEMLQESSV